MILSIDVQNRAVLFDRMRHPSRALFNYIWLAINVVPFLGSPEIQCDRIVVLRYVETSI